MTEQENAEHKMVWLVCQGEYSDYQVLAVFVKRLAAELFVQRMNEEYVECYVDCEVLFNPEHPRDVACWFTQIFVDTGKTHVEPYVGLRGLADVAHGAVLDCSGAPRLIAYGRTKETCIQAANDLRAQFLASGMTAEQWNQTRPRNVRLTE